MPINTNCFILYSTILLEHIYGILGPSRPSTVISPSVTNVKDIHSQLHNPHWKGPVPPYCEVGTKTTLINMQVPYANSDLHRAHEYFKIGFRLWNTFTITAWAKTLGKV